MSGYLNLFENECNFIGDRSYVLAAGCPVTLSEPPYAGKIAVLQRENNRWVLLGDDFSICPIQGVSVMLTPDDRYAQLILV